MDAHPTVAETPRRPLFAGLNLSTITTATIANDSVRFMLNDGKLWMVVQDLVKLLGYKHPRTSDLRLVFKTNGCSLDDFLLGLPLGRRGLMLINEAGLRLVCELVKPERTQRLNRWLEEGGMQRAAEQAGIAIENQPIAANAKVKSASASAFEGNRPLPGNCASAGTVESDEAKSGVDASFDGGTPQPDTPPNNVISLVPPRHERRKHYCRELCRMLLRYTNETETRNLVHLLEDVLADQLASRYSPGLNAAAYDVFARYGLKGGAQ